MMLLRVKDAVGNAENVLNGVAVPRVLSDTDADGKVRSFDIFREPLGNALRNTTGILGGSSGQNQGELIAAITGGRIDGPAAQVKDLRHPAESEAPHEMAMLVINLL
jgi:hypothetical protein